MAPVRLLMLTVPIMLPLLLPPPLPSLVPAPLQKASIEGALASLHTSRSPAMLQLLSYVERVSLGGRARGLAGGQTLAMHELC